MDWEIFISLVKSREFVSAIAGAIIGGGIVVWWDRHKRQVERLDRLKSLLVSIRAELHTLWTRYNTGIGVQIETVRENTFFNNVYLVSEEYFTVYNNNAHLIGQLSDRHLVAFIISIYIKAKGLVDGFRLNNITLSRRNDLRLMSINQDPIVIEMLQGVERSLVFIASQLKIQHDELKAEIEELFEKLDNAIKSNVL